MEKNPHLKRILVTGVSIILVLCMLVGIIYEYVGLIPRNKEVDDTVYLRGTDLVMGGEVLYSGVTLTDDRKLVLSNGWVLMENVTVDPDGSLYGKVNAIE